MVAAAFFYLFAAIMTASGFMVIASRNPVHSVLFLILAFVNAAGLFLPGFLTMKGFKVRAFNTNVKTKRELIDKYRAAVELQQVRLLRDANLIREHESMSITTSASGLIQYAAPGRQHDDIVMASALAYRAATEKDAARLPSMMRTGYRGLYEPAYSRRYPGWQKDYLHGVRRAKER